MVDETAMLAVALGQALVTAETAQGGFDNDADTGKGMVVGGLCIGQGGLPLLRLKGV